MVMLLSIFRIYHLLFASLALLSHVTINAPAQAPALPLVQAPDS